MNDIHPSVQARLNLLRGFLDLVGASLDEKYEDFAWNAQVDSLERAVFVAEDGSQDIDEDRASETFASYEGALRDLQSEYPALLYSSFVTMWYALVENAILQICEYCGYDTAKWTKGVMKIAKDALNTRGVTLEKTHWDEIRTIGSIRNAIVHRRGIVNDGKMPDECIRYLEAKGILSPDKARIIPDRAFCETLVDMAARFFDDLATEVGNLPRQADNHG